jgi:hypothetical protein
MANEDGMWTDWRSPQRSSDCWTSQKPLVMRGQVVVVNSTGCTNNSTQHNWTTNLVRAFQFFPLITLLFVSYIIILSPAIVQCAVYFITHGRDFNLSRRMLDFLWSFLLKDHFHMKSLATFYRQSGVLIHVIYFLLLRIF